MSKLELSKEQVSFILTPEAIRERTSKIFELCQNGGTHFELNINKLEEVTDFVIEIINKNYPDHNIPFHSRWGHFQVGKIDRIKELNSKLSGDKIEKARAKIDLVITSVLLDAGAGMQWQYEQDGEVFSKSEGLAVASFNMFMDGSFSSAKGMCADSKGLQSINPSSIKKAFQVSDDNPLVATDGRAELLNNLGKVVGSNKDFFKDGRPGNLIDYLISNHGSEFKVKDILQAVLKGLGEIWPGRLSSNGINLGDVWEYSGIGSDGIYETLIPFHKLSQWLTYSLVGPMEEAGLSITGAHELTGLAEYRNGGLFLDKELISLRDKRLLDKKHKPNSDLIIEWRALTICLLDKVGELVCKKLGKSQEDFPLAKVLEGGTWHAGRAIAKELRSDGGPPLKLDSDGTVF